MRLQHVGTGRDAGLIFVLGDGQRARVSHLRVRQQLALGIGAAQLQIGNGQLAAGRKLGVGQIRGAGLGAVASVFKRPAQAPPHIQLPVGAGGELVGG